MGKVLEFPKNNSKVVRLARVYYRMWKKNKQDAIAYLSKIPQKYQKRVTDFAEFLYLEEKKERMVGSGRG